MLTRTEAVVVAEVAAYLDGLLKPGLDPNTVAQALVDRGAPNMGDWLHIEVPARYSASNNPIPATFAAFAYGDE